jgi:hypothetical protein
VQWLVTAGVIVRDLIGPVVGGIVLVLEARNTHPDYRIALLGFFAMSPAAAKHGPALLSSLIRLGLPASPPPSSQPGSPPQSSQSDHEVTP